MDGEGARGGGNSPEGGGGDELYNNNDDPIPLKHAKTVPECIIHSNSCSEQRTKNLVSLKDIES